MHAVREHDVAAVLAEHRERLQARAAISQVTIVADDLPKSIAFYRDACDAAYHEEMSSFQFGTYPDDDFFLLTMANPESHPWHGGPAKFGLGVEDIDAAHARALAAGAVEIEAPVGRPGKPRSSTVRDPGGNHIDRYQG
ncbi:VOC family protein [Streptomyces canus]|uniref:VOC family protein n=1 Tax=Streptomyces canus TaxID=58343 RepID=UPI00340FE342